MYLHRFNASDRTWSVGFFLPGGTWHPVTDHQSQEEAEKHVHYLNGGSPFHPHPQRVGHFSDTLSQPDNSHLMEEPE